MKISLNWLKRYVDIPKDLSPEGLALKLTMTTVEVDDVIDLGKSFDKMVVGQVKEIVDHPNADKLKVCQVDIGAKKRVSIVCGGINLENDMYCVVALPGARVRWHGQGDPVELAEAKIRGVSSFGMICAAEEVGLDHMYEQPDEAVIINLGKGNWQVGQLIAEALQIDDVVFVIDNKSITHRPDLWGHYGIAREVAAILGEKLKPLPINKFDAGREVDLKIKVVDKDNCHRYLGVVIGDIKIKPSPLWLQQLLQVCGVRPINNLVDITNFVTLELGQPSHAFDRRDISGDKIIVRRAKSGEKFKTLDGEERKLAAEMCLICDSNKPVAIAGIMGGVGSEVKPDTTEIILELANFNPANVRRSALKLGLRTEAVARFEKGINPNMAELGMKRMISLIQELIPEAKVLSKVVDINHSDLKPNKIEVDLKWLKQRIGVAINKKEVINILKSLEFEVKEKGKALFIATPSFRGKKDVSIPEDIIEEVARIYGYDQIPDQLPTIKLASVDLSQAKIWERKVKNIMAQTFGLNEVYNYSWQAKKYLQLLGLKTADCLELKNYLSPEQQYLRSSLLPNLVRNIEDNLRWYKQIKIFELGRVILKQSGKEQTDNQAKEFLPAQPKLLSWLMADDSPDLFFRLKGQVEYLGDYLGIDFKWQDVDKHPYLEQNQSQAIYYKDTLLGYMGLLKANISQAIDCLFAIGVVDLNFSAMVKYIVDKRPYKPLSKYPVVIKDFSVIMKADSQWDKLEAELARVDKLIQTIEIFDRYYDKKKKEFSVAFHVQLYNSDKTLTSKEIEVVTGKIQSLLENKFKLTIKKQ